MNRTVVYPKSGAKGRDAGSPSVDEWGDKLVKYIPAEVLAFYIPAYALVETAGPTGVWVVFVLGVVGTVAYLVARADPADPPRLYFYLLSAIAFAAWAVGTSSIATALWNLPPWTAEVTVLGGVFLIPLTDEILTKYLPS